MKVLGLTGGIGSGKSYVGRILTERFDIPVYDCDTQAKRLNETSPIIREALIQLVGNGVYDDKGHLQKAILAQYLFQGKEQQRKVNAIIHPVVRQDFTVWKEQQTTPIVALESAILVESGFTDLADEVLLVTAPLPLRIQRAMDRDSATKEQVESRIRLQLSDEERQAHCQHTIINDGRDLPSQIQDILHGLS